MTAGVNPAGRPDPTRRGSVVVAVVSADGVVVVPDDPLVSGAEAAALAGVKPATWRGYVARGVAPEAEEPGRWRSSVVRAWARLQRRPGQARVSAADRARLGVLAAQWGCSVDEALSRLDQDS